MENIQVELWRRITTDLRELGDIEKICMTPRLKEVEDLFEDMSERFGESLDESAKKAFDALYDIAYQNIYEHQEYGIAVGMKIASELSAFIKNPEYAFSESEAACVPIVNIFDKQIDTLEKFLQNRKR